MGQVPGAARARHVYRRNRGRRNHSGTGLESRHSRRLTGGNMSTNGYARPASLVSTEWVAAHRDSGNLRLIEVDVDTDAYESGHIAGAVGWHWRNDLQRAPERDIPDAAAWEALLGRSGV